MAVHQMRRIQAEDAMTNVVEFPAKDGNGAREALIEIIHGRMAIVILDPDKDGPPVADWILLELLARGFIVVPVTDRLCLVESLMRPIKAGDRVVYNNGTTELIVTECRRDGKTIDAAEHPFDGVRCVPDGGGMGLITAARTLLHVSK
jgi:hypothetical protein